MSVQAFRVRSIYGQPSCVEARMMQAAINGAPKQEENILGVKLGIFWRSSPIKGRVLSVSVHMPFKSRRSLFPFSPTILSSRCFNLSSSWVAPELGVSRQRIVGPLLPFRPPRLARTEQSGGRYFSNVIDQVACVLSYQGVEVASRVTVLDVTPNNCLKSRHDLGCAACRIRRVR